MAETLKIFCYARTETFSVRLEKVKASVHSWALIEKARVWKKCRTCVTSRLVAFKNPDGGVVFHSLFGYDRRKSTFPLCSLLSLCRGYGEVFFYPLWLQFPIGYLSAIQLQSRNWLISAKLKRCAIAKIRPSVPAAIRKCALLWWSVFFFADWICHFGQRRWILWEKVRLHASLDVNCNGAEGRAPTRKFRYFRIFFWPGFTLSLVNTLTWLNFAVLSARIDSRTSN